MESQNASNLLINANEDDDDSYDFGQIENSYDDRIVNDGFLWKGCFKRFQSGAFTEF